MEKIGIVEDDQLLNQALSIAVLRRNREEKKEFTFRGLHMNFDSRKVWYEDREVILTPKEYRLLEFFVRNKGQVLTKEPPGTCTVPGGSFCV